MVDSRIISIDRNYSQYITARANFQPIVLRVITRVLCAFVIAAVPLHISVINALAKDADSPYSWGKWEQVPLPAAGPVPARSYFRPPPQPQVALSATHTPTPLTVPKAEPSPTFQPAGSVAPQPIAPPPKTQFNFTR
nr:hypothetical protein [Desulfobulbaceae bacterium]